MSFDAKAYAKEYRAKNRERLCAYDRERAQTPERKAQQAANSQSEHRKEWKRQWALRNPDKVKAQKKRSYVLHKDEMKVKFNSRYASMTPEEKRAYYLRVRAWKAKNKAKERAYQEKWADKNKDQIAARLKKYNAKRYAEHPEIFKARAAVFVIKNSERVKMRRKAINLNRAGKLREYVNQRVNAIKLGTDDSEKRQVVELIFTLRSSKDTKCYYCDEPLFGKKIHIDHIIPLSRGGRHCIENLCASCPSCNLSKNNKTPAEFELWKNTVKPLIMKEL